MLENSLLRDDPLPPWLCDATHWPQTQPHHNTSPAAHIFALNTLFLQSVAECATTSCSLQPSKNSCSAVSSGEKGFI